MAHNTHNAALGTAQNVDESCYGDPHGRFRGEIYDFRDLALEGLRFSAAYCLRGMKNLSRANTQGLIDTP